MYEPVYHKNLLFCGHSCMFVRTEPVHHENNLLFCGHRCMFVPIELVYHKSLLFCIHSYIFLMKPNTTKFTLLYYSLLFLKVNGWVSISHVVKSRKIKYSLGSSYCSDNLPLLCLFEILDDLRSFAVVHLKTENSSFCLAVNT
jgi:hypothetical protein